MVTRPHPQASWRRRIAFGAALLGGGMVGGGFKSFAEPVVGSAVGEGAVARVSARVTLQRPQRVASDAADAAASPRCNSEVVVAGDGDDPGEAEDQCTGDVSARRQGALLVLPGVLVKRLPAVSAGADRIDVAASGQPTTGLSSPAGQVTRLPKVIGEGPLESPEPPSLAPSADTAGQPRESLPLRASPTRLPCVELAMRHFDTVFSAEIPPVPQSDPGSEAQRAPAVDASATPDHVPPTPRNFSLPGGGLDIRQLAPTRFAAPLPGLGYPNG